jgi:phosphomannomutase
MSVFKAYDIRGTYPDQIDERLARRIGAGFAKFLSAQRLVVGRDMRTSSPAIQAAVIEGIAAQGCDVIDIGLASTPMGYFAIGRIPCDGGLIVTASHNPKQYTGFKLCREGARPLSGDTGIKEIERIVAASEPAATARRGSVRQQSVKDEFVDHIASFASDLAALEVAVDYANGMGAAEGPDIFARLPIQVAALYDQLDGTFPNHEANPLLEENLDDLRAKVAETGADVGVSFDGDADRCAFVDHEGRTVSADLITAILARDLLARHPGKGIIYDLRSSRVVAEEIRRLGGRPVRERVGHSFMKETMRREDCVGGGELSGHFYFAENYFTDCGVLACIKVLNQISREGRTLKEMADGLRKYFPTGEVNFRVADKTGKMQELAARFSDGAIDWLDGITVQYPEWWFNVRPSNTEPYLRLCLEADTARLLEEKRGVLYAILGEPV